MASTIEKLLMQTTHTRSEVLEYQNELINKLEQETSDEIIYKDQRFNDINKNIRDNFLDMAKTIKEQIIKPKCPNFKKELDETKYLLLASVTLNLILIIITCISRCAVSRKNKEINTATNTSSLL